eukprot:GHVU01018170.1.p1 GENE.GHVU01018170.1~~GHVU01018170.1.p1  ORF type:complete len:258 (+),score=21.25 GHVU01018170.1:591-1364(+)
MGNYLLRMVFQPPQPPTYEPDRNLIWLTTKLNERIPAFFINRNAKTTVIFSHGNAEDLGMISGYFREWSESFGVNIFAFEYTGYGLASGKASEEHAYADAEAAYEYVTKRQKIPGEQIVLYGRSLGSAVCVNLAMTHKVRGLILQSPLLSIHRVGVNLRYTLWGDMFCSVDKIDKVTCPVFIVHGTHDDIIPVYHGKELFIRSQAPVTPLWVEGGGHNDLEMCARASFFPSLARFFHYLESDRSPTSAVGPGGDLTV